MKQGTFSEIDNHYNYIIIIIDNISYLSYQGQLEVIIMGRTSLYSETQMSTLMSTLMRSFPAIVVKGVSARFHS